MKNYIDLVNFVKSKIGVNYLYGYKGEIVKAYKNTSLAKQYPSVWTSSYLSKANGMIGSYAVDCSGLISWFTGKIRGSSQYYETSTKKIKYVKSMDLSNYIGYGIWRQGHIGVIVGKNEIVEARGINYGVVLTKANERDFTYIIKLCDIDYTEKVDETNIGWYEDSNGWWYRHTIGTGPDTYYHSGIFQVPTSKGVMYFGFDDNGYMIEDISGFYITDFGNIEVK